MNSKRSSLKLQENVVNKSFAGKWLDLSRNVIPILLFIFDIDMITMIDATGSRGYVTGVGIMGPMVLLSVPKFVPVHRIRGLGGFSAKDWGNNPARTRSLVLKT